MRNKVLAAFAMLIIMPWSNILARQNDIELSASNPEHYSIVCSAAADIITSICGEAGQMTKASHCWTNIRSF